MFEKLDLVKARPARVLDIGCGKGQGMATLSARFPQAQVFGVDSALPMLLAARRSEGRFVRWLRSMTGDGAAGLRRPHARLCADAQRLPVRTSSVDLLWSNLLWHWLDQPLLALQDWYRVIRPGGLLMFSSFGVDTGRELAALGWPIPAFPDMHDIGDALSKNGFAEPVMDTERITLEYRDPLKLIAELSALGGHASRNRRPGLSGRSARAGWLAMLGEAQRAGGGILPVTVEVVYGHAWCGAQKRLPDGLAPVNWLGSKISSFKK